MTTLERFWSKVDDSAGPDACWPWTAAVNPNGYGRFCTRRRHLVYAHRFAYETSTGERIPDGMQVHHACCNRACCNRAHMEVVTAAEHALLSEPAQRTHCPSGHAYDAENTYVFPNSHRRKCRSCHRDHARRARSEERRVAA